MVRRPIAVGVLALLAGCGTITDLVTSSFDTNDFSGDQFPITVQRAEGAVIIGVSDSDDSQLRTAVLDVLSPVTVIDNGKDVPPSIDNPDLLVLGQRTSGGALDLPRGKFHETQVLTLHPCQDDVCVVGTQDGQRAIDAVVGMSVFASDALRLRLADNQIFILPDIAGDEFHRSFACDAVFPSPFRGGGTLLVGGTEVPFPNRRIAIDSCLDPRPDPTDDLAQSQRGTNVLLVASTGIGPSLLDESAYARYRENHPTLPEAAALVQKTVFLPSGPVTGGVVQIPTIALVGNWTSNPRAPCRQVYASHLLVAGNCLPGSDPARGDCPCDAGDEFCSVPAIVELKPTAQIEMIVVPNANPTLQSLRTELRPDRPEVDGILGANALQDVELDVDFPHGRLLGRCTGDPTLCQARPELPDENSRHQVQACINGEAGPLP